MRSRGAARLRRTLLVVVAILFVLSIPWYRRSGAQPEVWLGLPDWAAVAVCCYVAIAVLNAWAWLLSDVPDPSPEDDA